MIKLAGKRVAINLKGDRKPSGFRVAMCRSVTSTKSGGVKWLTVQLMAASTGRYTGKRMRVFPNEFVGVMTTGRFVEFKLPC